MVFSYLTSHGIVAIAVNQFAQKVAYSIVAPQSFKGYSTVFRLRIEVYGMSICGYG